MSAFGSARWDVVHGRALYDAGMGFSAIGRAVGITGSAVQSYALRNWPAREPPAVVREPSTGKQGRYRPGESTLPVLPSLTGGGE